MSITHAQIKKDIEAFHSFENLIASLGNEHDKSSYSAYSRKHYSDHYLRVLYNASWMFKKGVNIVAKDMIREWRTIDTPSLSPDQIKQYETQERKQGIKKKCRSGVKWHRLFGGGALIASIDNTGPMDTPLDFNRIQPGSLRWIRVVDKTEITNAGILDLDDTSENFMNPKFYHLRNTQGLIHWTRVFRFTGLEVPRDDFILNGYWGDSEIPAVYSTMVQSDAVQAAIHSLVYEAKVDVISIKGLKGMIAKRKGRALLAKRFKLAGLLKSINNTFLLDTDEKFDSKSQTFAGLPDVMQKYLLVASSAWDIPVTRFIGQAASGLNATGEHDKENYYNKIYGEQEDVLEPALNWLDEILTRNLFGQMPEDWSFTFNSLDKLNKKDEAEVENKKANTAQTYHAMGAVPTSVISQDLLERGVYSGMSQEVVKANEELDKERNQPVSDDEIDEEQTEETEEKEE